MATGEDLPVEEVNTTEEFGREGLCREYRWIFIRPGEDLWTEEIRPRNSSARDYEGDGDINV